MEFQIPVDIIHGLLPDSDDENDHENVYMIQDMDIVVSSSDTDTDTESSSDEDEQACADTENIPEKTESDPSLYVIPPTESMYQSEISRSEHLLATSAFATRHNLSDTALSDLLQLLQLHLPGNNIGETSGRKLKESCGFNKSYLKYHMYCDKCKKLFDTETDNCITPGCDGIRKDVQCKNYFVTSKICFQLQEILEREGVWRSIEEFRNHESEHICDITSGNEYRKLKAQGGFLHMSSNLTLSLFIDGIPLFKSSSTSLWPVYLLINEIPPKERYTRKNMVLWGVWQGVGKPKMNMFLKPLVIDLVSLYQQGFTFTCPETMLVVTVKAMLIIATMDLQARAYVVAMTQHNGLNGCLYCMEPGQVVASGKGHCRAYLYRDQPAEQRTDETLRENADSARNTRERVNGVIGLSVLWYLPYFSFTNNVVIDYMHGTLLGVSRKMLELWFDKTHSSEPFNISQRMGEVDKDLKRIKPLYVIHRLPRVLTNTYTNWKASEIRNWLLFYSLPCLKERLPDIYLTHFSCLVEAVYILLQEGISPQDLQRAKLLLQAFVRNMQILYGERFMSLNVHNLTHMVRFVELWGPLWAWSCFCFESFNGEIKKSIHGTGNVCNQIFWTLQAQKRIESATRHLPDESKTKVFMQNMTESSERFGSNADAYQCKVVKVTPLSVTVSNTVKMQLKEYVDSDVEDDFVSVSKIARNGFMMYSMQCSKVKKKNSYTICLSKRMPNFDQVNAVEVKSFIMEKRTRKVFALGRGVENSGSILQRRVPHLQKLIFQGNMYDMVVPVEHLGEPLMVIDTVGGVYGALLPNKIERD
ncbi:uncharacterized protein LOC123556697 [Mercenaria mercenaria]|uniref:uncharacterized protein LOC123556697 n=1 Tax=Mercenaria mercenaria TaxID=6596 RepID=UPI00234EAE31|nr:uncharacterized protein LOC123556697 [Mercenaria mercenaria]